MARLLYISHCVPYPPDKGERIRAFHQVRALASEHELTVACLARSAQELPAAQTLRRWATTVRAWTLAPGAGWARGALAALGGRSVTEGYFHSGPLRRQLRRWAAAPFDLVWGYSSAMLPYVLAAPAAVRVLDLVDLDSLKWAAYADAAGGPAAWLYRREARALAALEGRARQRCQATLAVSAAEAACAPADAPPLLAVPNGVDAEYFRPVTPAQDAPPELAFVGTMSYRPNIEAVRWFARHVWPALKQRCPAAGWRIVGRQPPPEVTALARQEGVRVTGAVPDVRGHVDCCRLAVAPLQTARGIQNKVLEALAMGRAVLASPAAAEGLDATADEGLLQAHAPQQWVEVLADLLGDPPRCGRLGLAGRAFVLAHHDWDRLSAPLLALCRRLLAQAPDAPPPPPPGGPP